MKNAAISILLITTMAACSTIPSFHDTVSSDYKKVGKTDITLLDDHGIKTHIGLPDWNKEMSRIKKNTGTNKVDLFYCGPSRLKGKLQKECLKQDISYSQRKF